VSQRNLFGLLFIFSVCLFYCTIFYCLLYFSFLTVEMFWPLLLPNCFNWLLYSTLWHFVCDKCHINKLYLLSYLSPKCSSFPPDGRCSQLPMQEIKCLRCKKIFFPWHVNSQQTSWLAGTFLLHGIQHMHLIVCVSYSKTASRIFLFMYPEDKMNAVVEFQHVSGQT